MTKLTVLQHDDVLVVASRLIAQNLDIEHRSFVKTPNRYKSHIESGFGVLRFEVAKPSKGIEISRPNRFAWLTEDQTTFVMTLSRNTDRVVQCKMNLIKAFSEAKSNNVTRLLLLPCQMYTMPLHTDRVNLIVKSENLLAAGERGH